MIANWRRFIPENRFLRPLHGRHRRGAAGRDRGCVPLPRRALPREALCQGRRCRACRQAAGDARVRARDPGKSGCGRSTTTLPRSIPRSPRVGWSPALLSERFLRQAVERARGTRSRPRSSRRSAWSGRRSGAASTGSARHGLDRSGASSSTPDVSSAPRRCASPSGSAAAEPSPLSRRADRARLRLLQGLRRVRRRRDPQERQADRQGAGLSLHLQGPYV